MYWVLKEKEQRLGVKVYNISQHGQHWESTLSDLLKTSKVALNAIPIKGVTDILLLGKTNALLIFVKEDDAVNAACSYEGINTKTIWIEIGVGQIARVYCPNYQSVLPTIELLSVMYLIGVALSLKMMPKGLCHRIKIYGWLIFKGNFNLGVELLISNDKPQVNILFISSNFVMLNHYFNYLHKFVK